MSGDRFTEHYRLVSTDPEKRAELLADPKAALAAYFGAVVDGDYRIEVIEQRPDTITAVVPAPPEQDADLPARLADVSGRVYDVLHTTGIAGYLVPDDALTWVLRDMRAMWARGRAEATPTLHRNPATAGSDHGERPRSVRTRCSGPMGFHTIFGNPGSNELPLLSDLPTDFRYIHALHEGAAIGMADGYARASGRPAVVNLHAAAGTGNAMGNLTNTQAGHAPVIVTSGQQARRYAALGALLTNVDAPTLARPLVKWSNEPLRPQDVPHALSKGILLATSAPAGPVYLSLPLDDWDHDADSGAFAHLTVRAVHGDPVLPEAAVASLRSRLAVASNPLMILGPGTDDTAGWDGATRLAENLALPVLIAPSPSRCPFPTRHPNYRESCPPTSQESRARSTATTSSWPSAPRSSATTSSPKATTCQRAPNSGPSRRTLDEAARAPIGRALVGNPSDALTRLADTTSAGARPPIAALARPRPLDETGPAFSAEAILDALDAAKDENTVIAHEWTSVDTTWDRFDLSRPGSLFFPDAGALGWGLPAAIGLQLGNPARRVLAILGDGAPHYTVSALWTAARYRVPVVFVVARNREYAALKNFARAMHFEDVPALDLPDIDLADIAGGYGIPTTQVTSLGELTTTVRGALADDGPRLVEVPQQRVPA